MNSSEILPAIYLYLGESVVEGMLVFGIVWLVLRLARIKSPGSQLRFYLLPLLIPGLLSPAVHVLLPRLQESALIVQIERHCFPVATLALEKSRALAPYLLILFGVLLVVSLAQWGIGSMRHRRWLKGQFVSKADARDRVEGALRELTAQYKMPMPEFVLSAQPFGPYAWSGRRGWIVVPYQLLGELDAQELAALLAHELAHLKRGDTWLGLLTRIARDLQFYNPLAHWAYWQLEMLREDACDDLAVRITGNPLALASSLLKAGRAQQSAHVQMWAHGYISGRGEVERRVMRLVNAPNEPTETRRDNMIFATLTSALMLGLAIV